MRPSDYTTHTLPGYQLKFLRAKANTLKPSLRVWELDTVSIQQVSTVLSKQELVKIRFESPSDKTFMAVELAEKTNSFLCGLVGHTVILYKPFAENPHIQLPQREDM